MKQLTEIRPLIVIFLGLLSSLFVTWSVKAKNPVGRPENLQEEMVQKWYESSYTAPKASDEWKLDKTIPANYVPVPGEDQLFMVVNDAGEITGYRQRAQMADGTWIWSDVNPDIPDNYEQVNGLKDVYMVVDADGNKSYVKYIRNADDTFCFVAVNEKGEPLDLNDDAEKIPKNYIHETGNTYALYDDNGVLVGYRERVQNDDGTFEWQVTDPPQNKLALYQNGFGQTLQDSQNAAADAAQGSGGGSDQGAYNYGYNPDGYDTDYREQQPTEPFVVDNADGTFTETVTEVYTVTENGEKVTYQTDIITVYDIETKEIISTKQEGPYKIGSQKLSGEEANPDPSHAADTVDGETSRVGSKASYDTGKAGEVAAKLNAERTKQGKSALSVDTSGELYKLASIKAADMATYNYSSKTSPTYGTLNDMINKWGLSVKSPGENTFIFSNKSASDIHTRLQAAEDTRSVRMSEDYRSIAIAIVNKDGQQYYVEVLEG